jgi:hypothetical protein
MSIIKDLLDKEVMVYKNLHKSKVVPMYSIMYKGKVVGHAESICLKECTFLIRKGGQTRVRQEKRKRVHAFVVGKVWERGNYQLNKKIKYNPYVDDSFITASGEPVQGAVFVTINANGVSAMGLKLTQTNQPTIKKSAEPIDIVGGF